MLLPPLRMERRRLGRYRRLPGHGKDAQVELRINQPAWLIGGHMDTQFLEQPKY
jgi:hypothetical protein